MLKRDSRLFRGVMVLLLAVALSAVYVSSAQTTTPLTQFFETKDGLISVRLPDGWQAQEKDNVSVYATALVFGDSVASMNAAVDSLTTTQSTAIPGETGVIASLGPSVTAALDPTTGITTLFNTLISGVTQTGATVVQQQELTGGSYTGSIALIDDPKLEQKGLVGAFKAGSNYMVFTLSASPGVDFDDNSQMFLDILNAIRVPGETGSTVQPTTVPNTQPIPGNVTASTSGTFSTHLPDGYVTQLSTNIPNFGDALLFGSNQTALQTSFNTLVVGQSLTTFPGVGGMIAEVDPKQIGTTPLDSLVDPLLEKLSELATSSGGKVVNAATAHDFGGQYTGELETLDIGYIGVFHSDKTLLIAIVISDDAATNDATMTNILESIRIPAEAASAQPAVTEGAPAEAQTFRSSDERVSLDLPGDWTVLDHVADGNILAYGESSDAAMSRLYSVSPALATKTAITGNGGVVALYPMAQFGIDPTNPDLNPLMKAALANLKGYTVAQQPAPLDGVPGGVIAEIAGAERGYLALFPFGDQVGYVTATSATSDGFDAAHAMLMAIVNSVHSPAVPVPTEVPTEEVSA